MFISVLLHSLFSRRIYSALQVCRSSMILKVSVLEQEATPMDISLVSPSVLLLNRRVGVDLSD